MEFIKQIKSGELEKSVILLVIAGHGVHLFNILLHHNSCLDVTRSLSDMRGLMDRGS